MKIIFLDFDGVIFTLGSTIYREIEGLKEKPFEMDPIAQSLLRLLIRNNPDIRIVVSSVWRIGASLEELKEILGPELGDVVIDKTPAIKSNHRGTEIEMWIEQNKHLPIEDIIIIDDDSDMFPYMGFLFKTDSYNGFTARDWHDVYVYLKMKRSEQVIFRVKKVLLWFAKHRYYAIKYKIQLLIWKLRNL